MLGLTVLTGLSDNLTTFVKGYESLWELMATCNDTFYDDLQKDFSTQLGEEETPQQIAVNAL